MHYQEDELCCENCFLDESIQEHIRKKGRKVSLCSYCEAENQYAISPEDLKELFIPVIHLYTTVTNFYPMEYLKELDYSESMIWNKLTEDWQIFDDVDVAESIIKDMFSSDGRHGEYIDFLEDAVDIEDDWYGHEERQDVSKTWDSFCHEIKHSNRFFPASFNAQIISIVAKANERIVKKGESFFRSRIEKNAQIYPKERMGAPTSEEAKFGRMNPQGISYLYLSNDQKTCISEVRPNITDTVSVGTFIANKKLKLVNVIDPFIGSPFKYKKNLHLIYSAKGFLKSLGHTLALPVDPANSYLEYLPTQYICEFFKKRGYDGLVYRSSITNGLNYTFFEQNVLECIDVKQAKNIVTDYKYEMK